MPLQPTAAEGETVINGFICWSTAENNRVCYGNDRCPRSGGAGRCRSLVGAFPRARRGARWWMGRGKLGTGAGVLVEGSLISHRVKTPPPRLYTHPPGHCPCACCAAVAELALHVTSFLSFFSFSKKSLLQRLHLEAEWCKPVIFANRAWFRLAGASFSWGVGRWLWLCRACLVKNPWLRVNVCVYACVRT